MKINDKTSLEDAKKEIERRIGKLPKGVCVCRLDREGGGFGLRPTSDLSEKDLRDLHTRLVIASQLGDAVRVDDENKGKCSGEYIKIE